MAVVTISRQIGSLGDEIASLVAKKLNYQLIGPDYIQSLAEERDPDFKNTAASGDSSSPRNFWEKRFFDEPAFASLFKAVNLEASANNNIVLVGRGAQFVLEDLPGVLKVRIVAPLDIRAGRLMDLLQMSWEEAREFVEKYAHQRRLLVQKVHHRDLTDWALYDLIINTAWANVEMAAEIIKKAVESMDPIADEAALKSEIMARAKAKMVESAIRKSMSSSQFDGVDVSSGRTGSLVLSGYVLDEKSKETAEKVAITSDGVSEVVNDINVVYFSSF